MKPIFLLCLSCLTAPEIFGEMIGPVEYHLPTALADDWCVGNKLENRKSKTIVYIPNEAPKGEEFFEANINTQITDVEDIAAIKSSMAKQYSDMEVHLDTLEKGPDNLLYEWKVRDNGRERIHGWGRIFSVQNDTVTLSYQTDDLSKIEDVRCQWVEALKAAKIAQ